MASKTPKPDPKFDHLIQVLAGSDKSAKARSKMLTDIVLSLMMDPHKLQLFFERLFEAFGDQELPPELKKLKAELEERLAEMEKGVVRPATFIEWAEPTMPGSNGRAYVTTPDGQERFPLLHDSVKPEDLLPGKTVYLEEKGLMIIGVSQVQPRVGQVALFHRSMPGSKEMEISFHEEKLVVYTAHSLQETEGETTLSRGDRLLFCPRRQIAFTKLPPEENRKHRFITPCRDQPVIPARDIGNPHWILGALIRRLKLFMFNPELLDLFRLRPRCTVIMTGPTGTGKTLHIRALLYAYERLLVERTGRTDLGSRVIRVKVSQLLDEMLGRSDKNIDELMDDIHYLASKKEETADGEKIRLPVIAVLEEAEGIARRRGGYDGDVYDRIIGTLLQRLDDPTEDLSKLPLMLLTTTNRPDLIDAAMWRRLAGIRAHFSRLDRSGFAAVLSKKLEESIPYGSTNGSETADLRREIIDMLVTNLYSPNGEDSGQVELTLRDGQKLLRYRRDFLSGAIVEQAVANAIDQAVFASADSASIVGVSGSSLLSSLYDAIDSLADNLTPHNAGDYLDLPEYTSVAHVRRLRASGKHLSRVAQ